MNRERQASTTSPLRVDEIRVGSGILGITHCPGKKDAVSNRDLETDVAALKAWGAAAVVTLIDHDEFELLEVQHLGPLIQQAGIMWYHLPILDVRVPERDFETAWPIVSRELLAMLADGKRIVVHCRGGLGRAGTVAAMLLIDFGMTAQDAIALVRKTRSPLAIETHDQEQYARSYGRDE